MFDLLPDASPRQLRPHQSNAISMLRQSLGQGNKRVVLQAPTGFGKSITAAKIIESSLAKGNRVLFTVPRISLVDQTVAEFEREGIRSIGVLQGDHPRRNDLAAVQVATVQTLNRRLGQVDLDVGLVIVDECHDTHTVIHDIMARWPSVTFIGLSATPWAVGMGEHWQDLCIAVKTGDLIEAGFLSKFTAYAPDVPDLTGVKVSRGEYVEAALEEVMGGAQIVGSVVQTWMAKADNRPTLVFGVNCNHAKSLFKQFEANGIAAAYCDHATDSVERRLIEKRFRSGEIKVACSVRTLTTGVDWPVSCIVDAAPTRSEMLHVQKIGRGLRVNEGTEDLLILDHAGNSLRLGLVTDIFYDKLKKGKKKKAEKKLNERLPKPCSKCEALFVGLNCPECGHERKPFHGVEAQDGDLVEITPKKRHTMAEKQRFWSMALWLDTTRNKSGRLAKGLYRGKFGVWPQGLDNIAVYPDAAFWNYEKSSRISYAKRMAKQQDAAA
jgi:DNA repair protein RadD